MTTKAQEIIEGLCEIRKVNPDTAWMKKARKLGGRYSGKMVNWLYYEFPNEQAAQKAADYAADLGLHNNWDGLEVGIRFA